MSNAVHGPIALLESGSADNLPVVSEEQGTCRVVPDCEPLSRRLERHRPLRALYVEFRQCRKCLPGRRDIRAIWPKAQTVGDIVPPLTTSAYKESIGFGPTI